MGSCFFCPVNMLQHHTPHLAWVLSCYFTITWITLTNRKRVAEIQKTFIPTASGGSWSFCITYLDSVKVVNPEIKKGKIDYRNVLIEKDFAVFCEMRKIRKQIAESISGSPSEFCVVKFRGSTA